MAQRSLRLNSHSWCCSPAIHACEKGPEPKHFMLLFSTTLINAVSGPSKPSSDTGEKAVPAIPSRQKPLHVPSMSGQKTATCKYLLAYDAACLLNSWSCKFTPPRSAFIWSCCRCPGKEDVTSPLPHLSCLASACPYHPCLPIQRCRRYNSLSLYFHCLPFKGCRIPCSQSLWTLISFSR